jgi:hypothetical protein
VVSVLASGPNVREFKHGRGYGLLRGIKIRNIIWEVEPSDLRRNILHVKEPCVV